jgi:hypothetical protein
MTKWEKGQKLGGNWDDSIAQILEPGNGGIVRGGEEEKGSGKDAPQIGGKYEKGMDGWVGKWKFIPKMHAHFEHIPNSFPPQIFFPQIIWPNWENHLSFC